MVISAHSLNHRPFSFATVTTDEELANCKDKKNDSSYDIHYFNIVSIYQRRSFNYMYCIRKIPIPFNILII